MYLAGDIGGTKTVVGLFDRASGSHHPVREAIFPSRNFGALEQILDKFLTPSEKSDIQGAAFGVAGAIIDGRCKTTNLPWELDQRTLGAFLGTMKCRLLNDLEAMAFGMLNLPEKDLVALNPNAGPRTPGNVAVLAAGTGLGEAFLIWDGSRYHTVATEGGHTDFAPQDEIETDLLRFLINRFGNHVSYERILSGPGIYNVYSFLVDRAGEEPHPKVAETLASGGDPSAAVSELGLAGEDRLARETLELFCRIYGAEAGNLALKILSRGGVMVGGGIAPRLFPILGHEIFLESFMRKGRFAHFMKTLPLHMATNPRVAIIGAADYALQMIG
jgi:glucokinase